MSQESATNPTRFIGRDLGTVTILRLLGHGDMGAVYVGFQRTLKRQVAVKILPKSTPDIELALELFGREAETVATLNHPNVVPIYEIGEQSDCWFQVSQLVTGESIETLLARRRKNPLPALRAIPLKECIRIVGQVLDGLEYAHTHGVVHRDIKPANILVDAESSRVMITDFGIAHSPIAPQGKSQGLIVGSPVYMAPEQAAGGAVDPRTDIYSTGVVLYEMAAGRLPCPDLSPLDMLVRKMKAGDEFFDGFPTQFPAIAFNFETILLKATAADPAERHASCAQLRRDLESYRDAFLSGVDMHG